MNEMIALLRSPEAASPILVALAQLAIMIGGLSLMLPRLRRFAIRLLGLGVFFVAAAAVVPEALAASAISGTWWPGWLVIWLAVAGGSILILGATSVGVALLAPAVVLFFLLPAVEPELPAIPSTVKYGVLVFVAVLGAILVLKIIVQLIYGPQAAGHVAGTYLVRVLDAFGHGLSVLLGWPLRLWHRLRGE